MTLVNSELLPLDTRRVDRAVFEKMGIVFGEPVDDLFVRATLPEGWKKKPTDHSMWSKVVDERGRERISVFYKAAFYDRSAHMFPVRRFSTRTMDEKDDGFGGSVTNKAQYAAIVDGETVIFRTDESVVEEPGEKYVDYLDRRGVLEDQALAWLNEHYPDWQDPSAYWELE